MDLRTCAARPEGRATLADQAMGPTSALPEWRRVSAMDSDGTASFSCRDVAGLRVVECIGGSDHTDLLQQFVRREGLDCVGVQIIRSGCEALRSGNDCRAIGPGELIIWTSDVPVELTSAARLHKVSLVVPWAELRERLPRTASFRGAVLDGTSGLGAVLHSHVDALARQVDRLSRDDLSAVRRATIELLGAAILYRVSTAPQLGLSHQYLIRIQSYIVDHLQDEDLGPASIAKAHHISQRYLHLLFSQTGQGVSGFIRARRLERCRETLSDPTCRNLSVAEIAHRWGFPAPAHFSRIFKQHFGGSPSELRCVAAETS
jgi:AraC-like DNA-binding protein